MKFKAGDLRKISDGLRDILQKELPIKPSYWLGRIANKVLPELKTFEETRMSLIKKYTKKDKKGNPLYKMDKNGKAIEPKNYDIENEEEFLKEFKELAEQEIEININPIKLDDLGDIKMQPAILAKLDNIIVI